MSDKLCKRRKLWASPAFLREARPPVSQKRSPNRARTGLFSRIKFPFRAGQPGIPSEPAEEVLRQNLEKGFQGLFDVICVLEPNDLRPKYALTVVEHRGG